MLMASDASDWDSASTASKRTLPHRRLASPAGEMPECSHPSVQEEEEEVEQQQEPKEEEDDDPPTAPFTPQSSTHESSEGSPELALQPQPRARKLLLLKKPESEEGQRCNSHLSTLAQKISLRVTSVSF